MRKLNLLMLSIASLLFTACSEKEQVDDVVEVRKGKGSFLFKSDDSNLEKSIPVYFYVPENYNEDSRVVFVFHGGGRNADDYRNAWLAKANLYNAIIVAPKFSSNDFPGGDGYNLGNVYVDGDNPTTSTLNAEYKWAFSYIEPLFDLIKDDYALSESSYYIFGHSAGSQFAHRFMKFIDDARVEKAVFSSSGWYTTFEEEIKFPYGLNNSVLKGKDFSHILSKKVFVQVGEKDTDVNDPSLRHNSYADAQGMQRVERANFYYNNSKTYAEQNLINYNWEFMTVPNTGHEYFPMCENAADLLFN